MVSLEAISQLLEADLGEFGHVLAFYTINLRSLCWLIETLLGSTMGLGLEVRRQIHMTKQKQLELRPLAASTASNSKNARGLGPVGQVEHLAEVGHVEISKNLQRKIKIWCSTSNMTKY